MPEDDSINPIRLGDALRNAGFEPIKYPFGASCVSVKVDSLQEVCHLMFDLGQHFTFEDWSMRPEIQPHLDQMNSGWYAYWPMQSWDFVGHP